MKIIKKPKCFFMCVCVYLVFKIGESCSAFIHLSAFDPNFAYLKTVAPLALATDSMQQGSRFYFFSLL